MYIREYRVEWINNKAEFQRIFKQKRKKNWISILCLTIAIDSDSRRVFLSSRIVFRHYVNICFEMTKQHRVYGEKLHKKKKRFFCWCCKSRREKRIVWSIALLCNGIGQRRNVKKNVSRWKVLKLQRTQYKHVIHIHKWHFFPFYIYKYIQSTWENFIQRRAYFKLSNYDYK